MYIRYIKGVIMTEIWKEIPGYEGLYEASNKGNIRSLPRMIRSYGKLKKVGNLSEKEIYHHNPSKVLSQSESSDGYMRCILSINGKRKMASVHRLVAKAFVDNENNNPVVNHIDENKKNNVPSNLEWVTVSYNNAYGTRMDRVYKSKGFLDSVERHKKKISRCDLNGNILENYDSGVDAYKANNIYKPTGISNCLKGRMKTYKGFIWKYV